MRKFTRSDVRLPLDRVVLGESTHIYVLHMNLPEFMNLWDIYVHEENKVIFIKKINLWINLWWKEENNGWKTVQSHPLLIQRVEDFACLCKHVFALEQCHNPMHDCLMSCLQYFSQKCFFLNNMPIFLIFAKIPGDKWIRVWHKNIRRERYQELYMSANYYKWIINVLKY